MKISKIEAIPFACPIRSFEDAYAKMEASKAVLVKIFTDDGFIGYGEASAWQPEFYGETLESVVYAIQKYISPAIIGQNPMDIGPILSVVDASMYKTTCAKEGIDLALFDLLGRVLNTPVHTLINGSFRNKIQVASEIGINRPNIMADDALRLLKMGIKVIKIKGSHAIEEDVKRIKAVREAVGDQAELRLDPNSHWTTFGTIKAMKDVEDCRLQLLEQPVPGWDLKGMSFIRKSIGIPLMADESVWTPQDVVAISEHKAADIINIKISKTGGLMLAKKIEAVAEAEGLICMVGTEIEPGFSLAAKLHLAASIKNLPLACEFTEISLLERSILKPQIMLEDGYIRVPGSAGLGFNLDDHTLEECIVDLTKKP
jgi:L-alanine-DL-glutamate epimerase-like enolase superfamily enzyme